MIIAKHLLKDGRPLQQFVAKLIDILLLSIQQISADVTKREKDSASACRYMLLIIRKTFVTLEALFTRIENDAIKYAHDGTLKKIAELESLKGLTNQLPVRCQSIRSMFEYLLL